MQLRTQLTQLKITQNTETFTKWLPLFGKSILLVIGLLITVLGVLRVIQFPEDQHYVYLAAAFLRGHLDVVAPPGVVKPYGYFVYMPDGRMYVPLSPLPALLMIPGVLVWGLHFNGGLVNYLLSGINAWLLWMILGRIGILDRSRRIWFTLLFLAGTNYFSAMNGATSWYQAHVLTVTLVLAALNETLGKRRAWLIGIFLGGLVLTRITAVCALPFYMMMLYDGRFSTWFRRMLQMSVGGIVAFILLCAYNYARFGTPFENGYVLVPLNSAVLDAARDVGLFSLAHVPKNLYAMFLLGPQAYPSIDAPVLQFPYIAPSYWGMGLFWSTPAFIAAFFAPRSSKLVRACWIACICVAIPLCLYYGIGKAQNGYRYALDFLPFLYINAVLVLNNRWGPGSRWLIYASIISSLWAALFFPALSIFKSV